MLKLYHGDISTCSQKVRLALAEKNTDFDSVLMNLRAGDQHKPEYRQLNPNAVVPTLVHDDHVIIESTVINEYIDDVLPGPALRPDAADQKAAMRIWTRRLDESVHANAVTLTFSISFRNNFSAMSAGELNAYLDNIPNVAKREGLRDMIDKGIQSQAFPAAVQIFDRLLAEMNAALAAGPWLAGEDFSLADMGYLPYVLRLEHLALSDWWDDKPALADWFQRMKARVSYGPAVEAWLPAPLVERMHDDGTAAWPAVKEIIA